MTFNNLVLVLALVSVAAEEIFCVKIFLLDFRCKIFFFSSFYCHVIYYFDFYTNWKPILTDWVTKGNVRIYYKRLYESKAIFIII